MFKVGDKVYHSEGGDTIFELIERKDSQKWHVRGLNGPYKNIRIDLYEKFFTPITKLHRILS